MSLVEVEVTVVVILLFCALLTGIFNSVRVRRVDAMSGKHEGMESGVS